MSMHLMIDLETLGVRPDARIIEIGVAAFRLDAEGVDKAFSVCLDVGMQGGTIDKGTIDFWLKQSDEARQHLVQAVKHPPREALDLLEAEFSPWGKFQGIWSHGPAFDMTILQTLYSKLGRSVPWSYQHTRDTRTLQLAVKLLGLPPVEYPKTGTSHSGVDDAVNQAVWVQRMVAALKTRTDPLA